MAEPMKIRAQMKGDVADVRVRIGHVMETGQRKESGKLVAAHFIQTLTVALNGKTMVSGQIGTSISRDPVFGFKLRGAKAGDKVTITWVDNKGETRSDDAVIG